MLPAFLEKYFWDTDIGKADTEKNAPYIIERILEYGDMDAVRWMMGKYPAKNIAEVLAHARSLSPRSAFFWSFILRVPKRNIQCLQKQFRNVRSKHWIW